MRLQPLGKRLLIKIKEKEVPKGKLILQENPNDPIHALVIFIGDEVKKVKNGDTVFLFPHGGYNLSDGTRIIMEEDILAKVVEA